MSNQGIEDITKQIGMATGQLMAAFAVLAVFLGGFYFYLDGGFGSGSTETEEVSAPTSSMLSTIEEWKNAERHEQLNSAEYFVEKHKNELANVDAMRNTHNINMMKCIDQNAISAPIDTRISDTAQICVASLNMAMN